MYSSRTAATDEMLVPTLKHSLMIVFLLVIIICIVAPQESSKCLVGIDDRECRTQRLNYFYYCNKDGVMKRQNYERVPNCNPRDKLKLMDFKAFVLRTPLVKTCELGIMRYEFKTNTSCLSSSERDSVISPFLTTLSGKTIEEVMKINSDFARKSKYQLITLETECEGDIAHKMDMCKPASRLFPGIVNISLYFNSKTFTLNSNHSACYCYFKTYNSSIKSISTRAYDIRLHTNNRLLLGTTKLSQTLLWWQSGVLTSELTNMKLSGLSLQSLPASVWMDVYGRNINITCDTKPLIEERIDVILSRRQSNSSSASLSIMHIILIAISVLGLVIIIIFIVKCYKSRFSKSSGSGEYAMGDWDNSENRSSSHDDEHGVSINHGSSVVMYSEPHAQVKYSKACTAEEDAEKQKEYVILDTEQEEREIDNSVPPVEMISHVADVHVLPREPTSEGTYDRLKDPKDRADGIPVSSNFNIYNTTSDGVYSSLKM